uniref:glutathione S-transferase omega-1-like n=1 Tax=Styela clava TaxID=7725 RepID=UPI001939E187|nr:glutathione S-transferase omega-1-like [Styela clava]
MSPPRHMTNEDPFPEKTKGKLRFYNMRYCPYALRARLMLTLKEVNFETINIHLGKKPEWFLEKFSAGTVPVIEIDEKILGESLVIAEYIDEVYSKPGEQIVPKDPYERARARMLISNLFPKVISAVYQRLKKEENWKVDFYKYFDKIEKILAEKNFFAGDVLGYADYMIWPWMRYFGPHCVDDALTEGRFPSLERWLAAMKKDPVVVKCAIPPNILAKFAEAYATREFVFDLE